MSGDVQRQIDDVCNLSTAAILIQTELVGILVLKMEKNPAIPAPDGTTGNKVFANKISHSYIVSHSRVLAPNYTQITAEVHS